MGVLKKRRAKLVADGRLYLWWVCWDPDGYDHPLDMLLRVVSDDKHFAVTYRLGQAAARPLPFVVVQGLEFPHAEGGCWRRVVCPRWSDDAKITPRFVRRLVDWCLDPEKEVVLVDCRGELLEGSTDVRARADARLQPARRR